MKAEALYKNVIDKAIEFGLVSKNGDNASNDIQNESGNAIIRKVIADGAFTEGKAYFGFIHKDETTSQGYSDFSWIIFPQKDADHFVMSLQIGTQEGVVKDRELLLRPGTRRAFLHLRGTSGNKALLTPRYKNSFYDWENPQNDILDDIEKYPELETNAIRNYLETSVASVIIDSSNSNEMEVCFAWLAEYAKIRKWPKNQTQIQSVNDALNKATYLPQTDHVSNIIKELKRRQFVVLFGAPGTGKTYTANEIAKYEENGKLFFEESELIQFHAETTYSEFVGGLKPKTDTNDGPAFQYEKGVLIEMIEKAKKDEKNNYLLVIDEINRANLANVLGPVFYLFEKTSQERKLTFKLPNGESIDSIPDNLYILATMNSSDRSIAVVDYALRRRFSWYQLKPEPITKCDSDSEVFNDELFSKMDRIFTEYATDIELGLQPGQSYFITKRNDSDEMKARLEYELKPLIREYLSEGYLVSAADSLSNFFLENGINLYE